MEDIGEAIDHALVRGAYACIPNLGMQDDVPPNVETVRWKPVHDDDKVVRDFGKCLKANLR